MNNQDSKYPRQSGSNTIVDEKDWYQDSPYGYCPACESIGMEELAIPGDPDGCFYCSDKTCKTIMGKRAPSRTKWNSDKPREVIEKELQGWSWNEEHFPGQEISDLCVD